MRKPKEAACDYRRRRFCDQKCNAKAGWKRRGKSIADRFWEKADKSLGYGPGGDCWEWMGHRQERGYGTFKVSGESRKAHRVAYEITCGEVPEGMCVCHSCDNPPCVNPDHLWLGTEADNAQDKMDKGRHQPLPGIMNGRAILTDDDVRRIRADGRTQKAIAAEYGVSPSTVMMIRTRRNWAHVD